MWYKPVRIEAMVALMARYAVDIPLDVAPCFGPGATPTTLWAALIPRERGREAEREREGGMEGSDIIGVAALMRNRREERQVSTAASRAPSPLTFDPPF